MVLQFDIILQEIGDFGRYQKLRFFLLCIPGGILCNFAMMTLIFITYLPSHHCRLPANASLNDSVPKEKVFGVEIPARCEMYENVSENFENRTLIGCKNGWNYDKTLYGNTVVSEWDLVCASDWYRNTLQSIVNMVSTLGYVGFSILQDVIGRKISLMIAITWFTVFGIASALAPEPISFTILYTIRSMAGIPLYQIPYIMSLEMVGKERRTTVNCVMEIFFAGGQVIAALIAYAVMDWRILVVVTTLPTIAIYSYWFLIDESPRWLLTVGRVEHGLKIIEKMAKINGKTLRKDQIDNLLENSKQAEAKKNQTNEDKFHPWHFFAHSSLIIKAGIITYLWLSAFVIYYGLSYNVENLGQNPYFTIGILGVAELPAALIIFFTLERIGRIWLSGASTALAGIFSILTAYSATWGSQPLLYIMIFVCKAMITASFMIVYQLAGELYPTVARAFGLGFSAVIASLFSTATPFVIYAAGATNNQHLPMIVFGVLGISAGILAFFLPETLRQPLPDTIEESETLYPITLGTFVENLTCKPRSRIINAISTNGIKN